MCCRSPRDLVLVASLAALACGEAAIGPADVVIETAKGGANANTTAPIEMTIDTGNDLIPDGKGPYASDKCGVVARATLYEEGWGFYMSPRGAPIPSSQIAACTGIAPRAGTIRMVSKHVSSDPHYDDPAPAEGGTFDLQNVKLAPTGLAVINAPRPCFYTGPSGKGRGGGLRLDAENHPLSNNLVRDSLGNGLWHLHTEPWPDNLAYCEGDPGITYWHVVVSIHVQIVAEP